MEVKTEKKRKFVLVVQIVRITVIVAGHPPVDDLLSVVADFVHEQRFGVDVHHSFKCLNK